MTTWPKYKTDNNYNAKKRKVAYNDKNKIYINENPNIKWRNLLLVNVKWR